MSSSDHSFSVIPSDIIDSHILTKLDGPALATAGCVSSELHSLCRNETLWKNVCNSTWPSINHPRLHDAISTFPTGYRSFFSNSFPPLHQYDSRRHDRDRRCSPDHHTIDLISAVDIRYKDKVVYSNLQVTNTLTDEFSYWPLYIDALKPTDHQKMAVCDEEDDEEPSDLAQHMTLSWIVIDPNRKLAANLSSWKPVLVESHYLSGYKQMRYSNLIADTDSSEIAEFRIAVTCGRLRKGELNLTEVNLQVLDNDGMPMSGMESLAILQEAMGGGKRAGAGEDMIGRYGEYLKRMRERKEKQEAKRDGTTALSIGDYACILIILGGLILWITLYLFQKYILRRKRID